MNQDNHIETVYEVFRKYTLKQRIDKCSCGCISDEEENKIYSKPLKDLKAEDLNFYAWKAITTWGNETDFKHFLPRLLELYETEKSEFIYDLEEIYTKLEVAQWKTWDKEEQDCIYKFVENDWRRYTGAINSYLSLVSIEDFSRFFTFENLLEMWDITNNKNSLKNLVDLIYNYVNEIFYDNNEFVILEIDRKKPFIEFIKEKNLITILENDLKTQYDSDTEYTDKIAVVLKMLSTIKN